MYFPVLGDVFEHLGNIVCERAQASTALRAAALAGGRLVHVRHARQLRRHDVRRGEREGVFVHGIDPLRLYVKMVALSYFHRSNAYTLSIIFRTDLLAPAWQEDFRREGEEMLRRYLSREGGRPSRIKRRARTTK